MIDQTIWKNIRFYIALFSMCLSVFADAEELALQTLPPGMVLDDSYHRAETERTILSAIAANQIDVLYLALHHGIGVQFCVDHLHDLEKTKQAQLLSRLLKDENFIQPFDKVPDWNSAGQYSQRRALSRITSRLLNEPLESVRLYSREELDAAALRLQNIK